MSTATGGPRRPRVVPDAPPHDPTAEQNILASCLTWPEQIPSVPLVPDEFYSGRNQLLWECMLRLSHQGEKADTVNVRLAFERAKVPYEQDYLQSICDSTIPIHVQPPEVRQVKRLAKLRVMHERAAALSITARQGEDVTGVYRQVLDAKEDLDAVEHASELPSLADVVEAMQFDGRRLMTGIETLDDLLRGGMPPRKLVTILGAPGGGKTTFTTCLMDGFEQQGASCAYVAADECREGIAVRLGQLAGHPRTAMESPHDSVRREFAKALRQRPHLVIVDPRKDRLTVEDVARRLHARAQKDGRIPVLIVDSIQTAPSSSVDPDASEYERIDTMVNVLEALAGRYGMLVIGISEMSRAAYKTGTKGADVRALAGGKGAGRIEYASDLQLSLTEVDPDKQGLVELDISKNRITGKKRRMRLQIDEQRASVREVEMPDETPSDHAHRQRLKEEQNLEAAKARVRQTIRAHRDLTSQRDVLGLAMGSRSHNATAYRLLERSGELVLVDGIIRLQERTCAAQ